MPEKKESPRRCQDCQFHKNKPSHCRKHGKYTARKASCEDFNRK